MSARRAFLPILIACNMGLAMIPVAASAGALNSAWLPPPGEHYSEFRGSHLAADAYFNLEGKKTKLGGELEGREASSLNVIGWKNWASLVIGIPARSVSLRYDVPPLTLTSTGLADALFGLRFKVLDGATALAVETDWRPPLGYEHDRVEFVPRRTPNVGVDTLAYPGVGDGRQRLDARLLFGSQVTPLNGFTQLSLGYTMSYERLLGTGHAPPPGHKYPRPYSFRKGAIAGSAELGIWAGPSWLIVGNYAYGHSVAADTTTDEFSFHRAGPEFLYRVDDSMDVFAGSSFTLSGKNVRRENEYYVGLAVKKTHFSRLQGFLGGSRRP